MANEIVEFIPTGSDDIRELLVTEVVNSHNEVVELVTEYKEQGDVDEIADAILESTVADIEAERESIAYKKAAIEKGRAMIAKYTEEIKEASMEEAKAGISADYDIDKGRAAIKEARATWAKSYASVLDVLTMVRSVAKESVTDEDGKTTSELVAQDKFGAVLLKVSSAPSIRAQRGQGTATVSEGAKIRAWGKDNGFADINDRGPLPTELKEAYAARNSVEEAPAAE